jgi:hypothetical protein
VRTGTLRRVVALATMLAFGIGGALAASGAAPRDADVPACSDYQSPPRQTGTVPKELHELSGLVASRRHDGIFWAHNDSGNALELYALDAHGTIHGRFPLDGPKALDAEDIAVGPCGPQDDTTCIYLGDIGDNGQRRTSVQLFRIVEPTTLTPRTLDAEALPFRYPDKARNAEALVVDPRDGTAYVISKTIGSLGDVYRVDGVGPGRMGTAVRVARLKAPAEFDSYTTGADVHPSGTRLLLRTYGRAWELRVPGARSLPELFAATPVRVPSAAQPQAEAIAYDHGGSGYVLGTEGAGKPIYRVGCRTP